MEAKPTGDDSLGAIDNAGAVLEEEAIRLIDAASSFGDAVQFGEGVDHPYLDALRTALPHLRRVADTIRQHHERDLADRRRLRTEQSLAAMEQHFAAEETKSTTDA